MNREALAVVYEDAQVLVVNKPPGVATTPTSADAPCLQRMAQAYLARRNGSDPVFLATCGRLDLPVTGIVVMAKTRSAAAHVARQFRNRSVVKIYQALVSGRICAESGSLRNWLRGAGSHAKVRVLPAERADARDARLDYRVLKRYPRATLVEITLLTGRKHQIRVQLSHVGHPIWGDYKYGSRMAFPAGIALLAKELRMLHPGSERPLVCSVPTPAHWPTDIEGLCLSDRTWLKRG
ncbi:MAG: RNA pseudouridine synthase [Planctomycetes bacterium]|nr:RNA pseudouridine synthase [Planctomycetota bacterium]